MIRSSSFRKMLKKMASPSRQQEFVNPYFSMGAQVMNETFSKINTQINRSNILQDLQRKGKDFVKPEDAEIAITNVVIRTAYRDTEEKVSAYLEPIYQQESEEQPYDNDVSTCFAHQFSSVRAGARLMARNLMGSEEQLKDLQERDRRGEFEKADGPSYKDIFAKYAKEPTASEERLFGEKSYLAARQRAGVEIMRSAQRGSKKHDAGNLNKSILPKESSAIRLYDDSSLDDDENTIFRP